MRRDRGVKLAPNVYQDQFGISARTYAKGLSQEKRFPADTELETIERWQAVAQVELLDRAALRRPTHKAKRGTLLSDGARYLKQIEGRPSFKADRSHLRAWFAVFGDVARPAITGERVGAQLAAWRTAGVAEQTLLHRWRVLKAVWRTLDGPKAPTPCDDVPRPSPPQAVPVGPAQAVLQRTVRLSRKLTPQERARLLVRLTTLQRPCQIMRAQPGDVDLRHRRWTVRPAKGNRTHDVWLNDDMVAAWRLFIKANAWGWWDTTSEARKLRKLCGWPVGMRPYNARHSGIIHALRHGADIRDAQELAGHSDIRTTQEFYGGVIAERTKAAGRLIAGRFKVR